MEAFYFNNETITDYHSVTVCKKQMEGSILYLEYINIRIQ